MTYSAAQKPLSSLLSSLLLLLARSPISVTRRILSRLSPTRLVRLASPCGFVVTRTSRIRSRSVEHQLLLDGETIDSRSRYDYRSRDSRPLRSSPLLLPSSHRGLRVGVHRVHQHYAGVPSKMGTYVKWGHHDDVETIIKSGYFAPIFVTGLSGNGKTTMIEQICANLNREFYRVNITAQTDEDDLLGGFRLIDGETVWCDGPVIRVEERWCASPRRDRPRWSRMMCLQFDCWKARVSVKKINEWVHPVTGFTILATANTKGQGDDTGKFSGTGMMNEICSTVSTSRWNTLRFRVH